MLIYQILSCLRYEHNYREKALFGKRILKERFKMMDGNLFLFLVYSIIGLSTKIITIFLKFYNILETLDLHEGMSMSRVPTPKGLLRGR